MTAADPVWLPGFFTGRLHAVTDTTDRMVFHGIAVGWSTCGRATVLDPTHAPAPAGWCGRCVHLTGPR